MDGRANSGEPLRTVVTTDQPKALIGWSVSDARQMDEANRMGDLVDYVGVGPVFDTPTKPDALAACGIDGLAALCSQSRHPTVISVRAALSIKIGGRRTSG